MPYESLWIERVLAYSRLFLAATSLIATRVPPLSLLPNSDLMVFVLLIYTVHSLGLLIWLEMAQEASPRFGAWVKITDVLWPLLLCYFTDPPNSIFYVFFFFALLASAFRGGFVETMTTAVAAAALLLAQAAMVRWGPPFLQRLVHTSIHPERIVLRCGFLLLAGFLLGYLAETEKLLRSEIALINRLLSMARIGDRFADTLKHVTTELGHTFHGKRVYVAAERQDTGAAYLWEVDLGTSVPARVKELSSDVRSPLLLTGYPPCFYIRRKSRTGAIVIEGVDDEGRGLNLSGWKKQAMPVPDAESVLAVSLDIGQEWTGRFVVIGAKLGFSHERDLRFVQNAMRQVGPALYSVYLFRRYRSRIGAMERARVARELHDTSIQSLISIEMQIDVLSRKAESDPKLATELRRIQLLLRDEVLNLRELMQAMRPVEIGPHQFLDFIAQVVERFGRDTGVGARFVSELQEVALPAANCRELARIVQEGLVNIRKHSAARSVLVRFGAQDGLWKLVIDDDGHGFPFAGRFTLAELDALRQGPTVIKERIRAIGGDMVIESTPGHGARLEITIPQKGYEVYG